MPVSPERFYERVQAASDDDGRLPLSRMTGWAVFPFESDGLQVVRLEPPVVPEPSRQGEGGNPCSACDDPGRGTVWTDDVWLMRAMPGKTGAPLLLILEPFEHFDLSDLPDDLAASMGRLIVHVARAVESLPHIARAHVSRWGDGGAHLHLFVYARPEGFSQLRGTCMAIWDDLLPATPPGELVADARQVAKALVDSYGGRVVRS